jgi:hypothetical protein
MRGHFDTCSDSSVCEGNVAVGKDYISEESCLEIVFEVRTVNRGVMSSRERVPSTHF